MRGGNASSRGREARRRSGDDVAPTHATPHAGVVAQQFPKSSSQKNRSAGFAERNEYTVLVAALVGGLTFTLQNAVDVLWKPIGTLEHQWLNEQDEQLGPQGRAKLTHGFARNCYTSTLAPR